MNNRNHFTIAIIKEARIDENRTPFTPKQIQTLITNFPNLFAWYEFGRSAKVKIPRPTMETRCLVNSTLSNRSF